LPYSAATRVTMDSQIAYERNGVQRKSEFEEAPIETFKA
jgi:hypothetical protein